MLPKKPLIYYPAPLVIEHVANSSFFKLASNVSQQYHWCQQEAFTPPRAYEFGGGSIIYGSMSLHYIQPDTRSFGTTVVLPYKSGIKSEQNNYATY